MSILTAGVTVRLALRQFYSKKWWERKAEAYSAVVESLSRMSYALSRDYSEHFEGRKVSSDEAASMWDQFRAARQEIERRAQVGHFQLAEEAVDELRSLVAELETQRPDGNWLDDLDRHLSATQSALARITRVAKIDLRVRGRRRFRPFAAKR
ncbi:MAG: hypothetical protein ACRD1T_24160 [Acidimicrobiia bacterium]